MSSGRLEKVTPVLSVPCVLVVNVNTRSALLPCMLGRKEDRDGKWSAVQPSLLQLLQLHSQGWLADSLPC